MLEAQKSTTAEMQQIMKHMQRQWNEQRELLEMALRAPRVCERQVPHESGVGGPPPETSVDVDHVGRQPEGRPNQYRAPRGRCHRCNEVGHFVRDCPQPDPRVTGPPSSNAINYCRPIPFSGVCSIPQ